MRGCLHVILGPSGRVDGQAESAADELDADLGVVDRPDGDRQLTFDGLPLCTFAEEGPGRLEGDGFVDDFDGTHFVWEAARASGSDAKPSSDDGGGGYGSAAPRAPVAAVAVTIVALVAVYHDDRVTAERYRETLAQADGRYFDAEPLRDETGARAGVVFANQGAPSWVLVTVDPGHRGRVSSGELVTRDGRTIPLASLELDTSDGSWGGAIPTDLYVVASIRLLGERPGEALTAPIGRGAAPER